MKDLNKQQRFVYGVIKDNPGSENDDAKLLAAVFRRCDWRDDLPLEQNLRRMPRPESITRRRRELHNMGLIDYSQEAYKEREEAFRNERELHGAVSWLNEE